MISRRDTLLGLAALAASAKAGGAMPLVRPGTDHSFSRAWLEQEARRLSRGPFRPAPLVPEAWRNLDYDQYRQMWFRSRDALWSDQTLPFQVDFFHPGLFFPRPVEINVVQAGHAQTLAFDMSLFDRTDQFPELPLDSSMGYSGLRLRAELQTEGIFTEFAVFQGASYFRAIGTGQNYGLSARGLAIDTARPEGEEFPEFTRFWLETPMEGDPTQVVHALLDGESCTGAYTFRIQPGDATDMAVEATLYPRRRLEHVGLGPLTSMFLFDQTNRAGHDDFRPAVHDSDGLLIHNGAGEVILRPLKNPQELEVSSFVDENPQGFGLVQRARDLADFEDFEALYHIRPALWVTPGEDWGQGAVQLVEIPSNLEVYDNIVAYWRPRDGLAPNIEHRFTYNLHWCAEPPRPKPVARVLNTAIGGNWDRTQTLIAIDFEDHEALGGDLEELTLLLRTNRGEITDGVLQPNPRTGGLRLTFGVNPLDHPSMELRAQLLRENDPVSEVWLYRWSA